MSHRRSPLRFWQFSQVPRPPPNAPTLPTNGHMLAILAEPASPKGERDAQRSRVFAPTKMMKPAQSGQTSTLHNTGHEESPTLFMGKLVLPWSVTSQFAQRVPQSRFWHLEERLTLRTFDRSTNMVLSHSKALHMSGSEHRGTQNGLFPFGVPVEPPRKGSTSPPC